MTKEELSEAIEKAPEVAEYYLQLAFLLQSPQETVELKAPIEQDPPLVMTQRELFLKTIELDQTVVNAYLALKNQLKDQEKIRLNDGRELNKRGLILEAIDLAPHESLPYSALGFITEVGEPVTLLDGRTMNRNQLFLEAVHLDRNNVLQWFREKYFVKPENKVSLPDGQKLNQGELIKEILTNPLAFSFFALALTLNPGETIDTGIEGIGVIGHLGLVLNALEKSPEEAEFYRFAGLWLKPGQSLTLPDGQEMNQVTLLQKSLEIEPENAIGYLGLGYSIGAEERVSVGGNLIDRQSLFLKAAELEPDLPVVYLCLSLSLNQGEELTILVNGEEMSGDDLLEKYNELNE